MGRGRWRGGGRSRSRRAAGAPPRTGTATPARPRPAGPPRRTPAPSAPRTAPPRSSSPPSSAAAAPAGGCSGWAGGRQCAAAAGVRCGAGALLALREFETNNASKEKWDLLGNWGFSVGNWNSERCQLGFDFLHGLKITGSAEAQQAGASKRFQGLIWAVVQRLLALREPEGGSS
jgi:hypothetical protein